MVSLKTWYSVVGVLGVTLASAGAFAQVEEKNEDTQAPERTRLGKGTERNTIPPGTSTAEEPPPPPAPSVMLPETGISKQAGVGSPVAYGRAGVLELGGSGGLSAAQNYTRFDLSPSVGLFVVDNVELSLITGLNYFRVGSTSSAPETHATELTALFEPSFHLPFSDVAFGFLGLGAGVNYLTSAKVGFALQPRLGANFLVGRSGILTPSLTVAYSTVDAIRTQAGTLLAVRTSYGMNIGYTVMW